MFFHLHHLSANRTVPALTFQYFADITVYRAHLKLDLSVLEDSCYSVSNELASPLTLM
jgi:hypothetical protein